MNKYQQIKNYVDDHFKYYAFYPFDIVLNMDTEEEETLSYDEYWHCLLYTSPSPRDATLSRMPSSA